MSSIEGPKEFDVTPYRALARRRQRPFLRIMAAMALGFLAAGFVVGLLASGGHLDWTVGLFTGLFAVGAAVPTALALAMRPWRWMTTLRVDRDGFEFVKSAGPGVWARWSDPDLIVRLREIPKAELELVGLSPPLWTLYTLPLGESTLLGPGAADAVVSSAEEAGLSLQDDRVDLPGKPGAGPVRELTLERGSGRAHRALPGAPGGPGPDPRSASDLSPGPPPALPATYDLVEVEQRYWASQRRTRTNVTLVLPLLVGLASFELYTVATSSVGWRGGAWGGFAVAAVTLGLAGVMFLVMGRGLYRRGPERLIVGADGLGLQYASRPVVTVPWKDPKTRIRLSDFRDSPVPSVRAMPCEVQTEGQTFRVSAEAADGVISVALNRGGIVFSRRVPSFDGRPIPLWDVRGAPAASTPKGWVRAR